jgi:hypothetical protein
MTDEWCIEEDLEEIGLGLNDLQSLHFPTGIEGTIKTSARIGSMSWLRFGLNTWIKV